jgi:hypothetical protein
MSATAVPQQITGLVPRLKGLRGLKAKTHNIYPLNSSGTTTFSPTSGSNLVVFNLPAFKNSWLDVSKCYLRFRFKTNTGTFCPRGIYPFERMTLRCGNQMVEDIQNLDVLQSIMSDLEPVGKKQADAYQTGDFRVCPNQTNGLIEDATTLKNIFNTGQVFEYQIISGVLSKDYQDHYLPIHFMNGSGGPSMEISFHLASGNNFCVRDAAGSIDFELSEVELITTVVEMPTEVNQRLDKELYNQGKVSIPICTFRAHNNSIAQNSQNAELSINESAMDLETIYTAIRAQNLPAIVNYDASTGTNSHTNLARLGGHGGGITVADNDAAYNQAKVKRAQYRYDTLLFPQKALENSSHDTKNTLLHVLNTLDLFKSDAFIGGFGKLAASQFDAMGSFLLANSFKTSRDAINNSLNAASSGAPVELSIALAKPAPVALQVQSFAKSNYTLNITRDGQVSLLNGSARETPVD